MLPNSNICDLGRPVSQASHSHTACGDQRYSVVDDVGITNCKFVSPFIWSQLVVLRSEPGEAGTSDRKRHRVAKDRQRNTKFAINWLKT